jgi:cobyrinic acid a,c-diamide synthase
VVAPQIPRVLIAAPSTGQGKTTIATGLMAALTARGHVVSGHKVGPDYIDPGYHALATGRPGRNLDPHLVGEHRIVPLLLHGARGADIAVIEGVMGLYDGRLGQDGFASSAHVARLTRSPIVLVMDVARLSRTAGAIAAGMVAFDPEVEVAGVILNRAGSARNVAEIERSLSLPVLGVVPRDSRLAAPSRHLGLVPVAERAASAELIELLGDQVAKHVDLDAVLEVAGSAPTLGEAPWDPSAEVTPVAGRPVVAVAGGRAFTFRYPETDELLTAAGCDMVTFDPLADSALPPGTQAIYLGGGFPEVYAAELAANASLMASVRSAVEAGVPTVAECAGLLYLAKSLDGSPMVGAIKVEAAMTERLTLRYPEAIASDSLLTQVGERITGHEFHRTTTSPIVGERAAWTIDGEEYGFSTDTLHASYLHTHWAGHPQLAQRFANAATQTPASATSAEPSLLTREPSLLTREPSQTTDLHHHGDVEATDGLQDFAVNVYSGPRPLWLDEALMAGVAASDRYPNAEAARAALAERHGRLPEQLLPTAGAAEAFELIARLRPWRRPVVVHPQFTEPHAALLRAGHEVTTVMTDENFRLHADRIPVDADVVMIGNPTNPTGVLHPAAEIRKLNRPGRTVVVDEAFMDAVPGEPESLADELGVVIVRSLTKHWSIPGIRAGYVLADDQTIVELARLQMPWSVSAPALSAMIAIARRSSSLADGDVSRRRAEELSSWREALTAALTSRGIRTTDSRAPFVLAQLGKGAHARLRERGIAVRRADTFLGLDDSWVRIAARPPERTAVLLEVLDEVTRKP